MAQKDGKIWKDHGSNMIETCLKIIRFSVSIKLPVASQTIELQPIASLNSPHEPCFFWLLKAYTLLGGFAKGYARLGFVQRLASLGFAEHFCLRELV